MDLAQYLDAAKQAAPYILLVLGATTALAHALRAAARAFERYAATTPTPTDDEVAHRLVGYADTMVAVFDKASAFLPRVGFGPKDHDR